MLRWEFFLVFLVTAHSKVTNSSKPVITTTPSVTTSAQALPFGYPVFPVPFPQPGPVPIYPAPPIIPPQPNPFHDHYAIAPIGHGGYPVPSNGHPAAAPPRVAYGQGFKRVTCRCCCREETITPRFRVTCNQPTPVPQPPCDCSRVPCEPCRCVNQPGCRTGGAGCDTPSYPFTPNAPTDCSRRPFDPDCNRVPIQYGGQGVEMPPFFNPGALLGPQPGYPDGQQPYPSESQSTYSPYLTGAPFDTTTSKTEKSSPIVAFTSALALIIARNLFA